MIAYHFVGNTLRDGRPVPPDGEWLIHDGPVVLCESGLHASVHPFDALQYAPGDTLCYCEYRGQIIHESDKFVAEQRRIVTRMDATEMLHYYARMQAISVAHLWEPPDVLLDFLMTGDRSLRATWAAWDAASPVQAAWAACDPARAPARAAARAARAATWAARDACDPARAAARDDFAALVYECFGMETK